MLHKGVERGCGGVSWEGREKRGGGGQQGDMKKSVKEKDGRSIEIDTLYGKGVGLVGKKKVQDR